jgi:flagellar assembly factor FliW
MTASAALARPAADAAGGMPLIFPAGLFGFPESRLFRLSDTGRTGLFWLESAEDEPLRFIVADPFRFFPGYSVELGRADEALLDVSDPVDVAILGIVTLPAAAGSPWTANLQAPIAFNVRTGTARQIVLNDPAAQVRAAFNP